MRESAAHRRCGQALGYERREKQRADRPLNERGARSKRSSHGEESSSHVLLKEALLVTLVVEFCVNPL